MGIRMKIRMGMGMIIVNEPDDLGSASVCGPTQCRKVDLVVIGGGPAGMAAAIEARKQSVHDILILEREPSLGGILNQCIHDGFGLEIFREALTGPEYMRRYVQEVDELGIPYLTHCMVLEITPGKEIIAATPEGLLTIRAGAIILSMACRERSRGAIRIPGSRPAGIYTAGTAQHFINLKDLMVGRKVVILGSGDIGMIMARRLTLEGARVLAVVEILPYSSGLPRNVVQCLEDYNIPLLLSHTVTNVYGNERVDGVQISEVGPDFVPIPGTSRVMECDTLLLSVGLIPENELSKTASVELDPITKGAIVDEDLQTTVPGLFACGNVLHVHDVVDWVTLEAEHAGRSAARFLHQKQIPPSFSVASATSPPSPTSPSPLPPSRRIVRPGKGIRYVVPQNISLEKDVTLSLRVEEPGRDVTIEVIHIDQKSGTQSCIAKKLIKRVNPAEMIRIPVKAAERDDSSGESYVELQIADSDPNEKRDGGDPREKNRMEGGGGT